MKTDKNKNKHKFDDFNKLRIIGKENTAEHTSGSFQENTSSQSSHNDSSVNNKRNSELGVYGEFTVTQDLTKYTRAAIFNSVGKQTPLFARFSVLADEEALARNEPYSKEFALKFYTEDGEWDIIGSNTPVLLANDVATQTDFLNVQKRDPRTNLKDPSMTWNFLSKNPESLHQIIMMMSNRGTPRGYKHMDGFGAHTYSMINADNKKVWVKFHFKTLQGVKTYTKEEMGLKLSEDAEFSQREFINSIENKIYPRWKLFIQVMTDAEAKTLDFNPFDVTKTWSQKTFPLIEAGILELNKLPEDYMTEVHEADFNLNNLVDGIGYSPDKMLQSKLQLLKNDTRPTHSTELKIINGGVPKQIKDQNHNTGMQLKSNPKKTGTYFNTEGYYDYYTSNRNDHYSQPGVLYRQVMGETERNNLIRNIVASMQNIKGPDKDLIINRQMHHWFKIDKQLGVSIAKGLELNEKMIAHYSK